MKKNFKSFGLLPLMVAGVFLVGGCASKSEDQVMVGAGEISDPFEGANRAVFSFNTVVDDAIIHPVAKGYNKVLPSPVRTGVTNALRNLRSPVNMGNQVLQGDFQGAGDVFVRAVVNTLVGVGGIFDVAGAEGIAYEHEDFGQTLATWGVGHGAYLVVPILGPSSARDYTGFIVDGLVDPLRFWLDNVDDEEIFYGKVGLNYLNLRASLVDVLEDLESSSIDYYAATRSAYYQRREALVNDSGKNGGGSSIPDYDDF